MSIYLAWSIYKLILVLSAMLLVTYLFIKWLEVEHEEDSFKLKMSDKLTIYLSTVMIIILLAFNIGDKQKELGRSNFNNGVKYIEQKEKTVVDTLDAKEVEWQFKSKLKETNGEY